MTPMAIPSSGLESSWPAAATASADDNKCDVQTQRRQLYGPNAALSYRQPLHLTRGEGCWLFDDAGNRYLDCVNNVTHCGHGNQRVAAAISSQLSCLNTNSRYLSGELTAYCRELTDTLPEPLRTVYLVNSGSEANDLALRIAAAAANARAAATAAPTSNSTTTTMPTTMATAAAATGQQRQQQRDHVVVMAGAYHGHLSSLIPLSPYKFWGQGGAGQQDWVHVMPLPDTLRGLNLDGAAAARAVLAEAAAAGGRVIAFFCESIVSCGGQVLLPPGYLAAVYSVMREAGVVCIADEVQTGFGRVGDAFWAFQLPGQGLTPDIVTIGKPMGNGFPIGGLVTSAALAAAFAAGGMEYFNTYGGSNAAVAAGRAVMREMKEQRLQQHAADMGRHLSGLLAQLQASFPSVIGDVRGCGLFWGIEFVTDPGSKRPAPLLAAAVKEGAKQRHVLLSTDGPVGHVIKLKPPLVFGRQEAELMVQVIRDVLVELTAPAWSVQLAAAEEQHWQQHAVPILARYAANEERLQRLLLESTSAAAAQAAGCCEQKQHHHQQQEVLGKAHSTSSSEEDEDLMTMSVKFSTTLAVEAAAGGGPAGTTVTDGPSGAAAAGAQRKLVERCDCSNISMASADSCVSMGEHLDGLSE